MKKLFSIALCLAMALVFAACSDSSGKSGAGSGSGSTSTPDKSAEAEKKPGAAEFVQDLEITLQLNTREEPYVGLYSGDLVNGLPHGGGIFSTENAEGEGWTYTGQWEDGHMSGFGETVWVTGKAASGSYRLDKMDGFGTWSTQYGQPLYKGSFKDGQIIEGDMYDLGGTLYYSGEFKDGRRVETDQYAADLLAHCQEQAIAYETARTLDRDALLGSIIVYEAEITEVLALTDTQEILASHAYGNAEFTERFHYYFAYGQQPHNPGDRVRVYGKFFDRSADFTDGQFHGGVHALIVEPLS